MIGTEGEWIERMRWGGTVWRRPAGELPALPPWRSDAWARGGWHPFGTGASAAVHAAAHAAMALRHGVQPPVAVATASQGPAWLAWRHGGALGRHERATILLAGLAGEMLAGAQDSFANGWQDARDALSICFRAGADGAGPHPALADALLETVWLDTLAILAQPGMERAVRLLAVRILCDGFRPHEADWRAACREAQEAIWDGAQLGLPIPPGRAPKPRHAAPDPNPLPSRPPAADASVGRTVDPAPAAAAPGWTDGMALRALLIWGAWLLCIVLWPDAFR